jgi:hypothetical protein
VTSEAAVADLVKLTFGMYGQEFEVMTTPETAFRFAKARADHQDSCHELDQAQEVVRNSESWLWRGKLGKLMIDTGDHPDLLRGLNVIEARRK